MLVKSTGASIKDPQNNLFEIADNITICSATG